MEGLDNRQIAQRLGVSERTARAHTSGVLRRLGEPNRTRAAVAALRRGLLSCLAAVTALRAPRLDRRGSDAFDLLPAGSRARCIGQHERGRTGKRRMGVRHRLRPCGGRDQIGEAASARVRPEAAHRHGRARAAGRRFPVRDLGGGVGAARRRCPGGRSVSARRGRPFPGRDRPDTAGTAGQGGRRHGDRRPHTRRREHVRRPARRPGQRLRRVAVGRAAVGPVAQPRVRLAGGARLPVPTAAVRRPPPRPAPRPCGRRRGSRSAHGTGA